MAIAFLTLLVIFSAFFSASETALFSLSSMKLKEFSHHVSSRKRLTAKLLKSPLELLVTILMLIVFVNILVQNTTSHIFGTFSSWWYTVGIPLGLTLIFGEIIPKTLAIANNEKLAVLNAPVIEWARFILGPIRLLLTLFTFRLTKIFFFFLKKEKTITTDELKHALITGKKQGILNAGEVSLMRGYMHLRSKPVRALMKPREEIIYFDLNDSMKRLEELLVDREVSKLPVCDGDPEHMKGIINIRQYFLYKDRLKNPRDVLSLVTAPYFVPESMPARTLLKYLDNKERSLAVVVDEYGAISGLITREDLIEAVIGEIIDRRDVKSFYTFAGKDAVIASGKLELVELEHLFGIHPKTNMVTVNGWIIETLGSLPKSGDKLTAGGFFLHILATDPKRIQRVYIRKLKGKA